MPQLAPEPAKKFETTNIVLDFPSGHMAFQKT
jgi:hypothetical protein